jgi:hypothetical protein
MIAGCPTVRALPNRGSFRSLGIGLDTDAPLAPPQLPARRGGSFFLAPAPGSDKCNQFVGDTLAEAGKTRPEIKDKDGNTRMPSAHEMADPNVHIPGLSDTKPLSEAQPGDVIAQEHGDTYGHSGIVATGSDGNLATVSANATGSYGGQITQNDWGFRPAGQNGESSTDPAPVVRHPEDQ